MAPISTKQLLSIILIISILINHHSASVNINCENVQGNDSGSADFAASTVDCSNHDGYTLVSCGYRTKFSGEDDIRGGEIDGQTCKAFNFAPSNGVWAIARCCDLSAYSVSCTTREGPPSDATNDAKGYQQCNSNEVLMGCAPQAQFRLDGGYPGQYNAAPFYSDTIDTDVDTWYEFHIFYEFIVYDLCFLIALPGIQMQEVVMLGHMLLVVHGLIIKSTFNVMLIGIGKLEQHQHQ